MFLIWAIPVIIVLAILVGLILYMIRGSVKTGSRQDGEVLEDRDHN